MNHHPEYTGALRTYRCTDCGRDFVLCIPGLLGTGSAMSELAFVTDQCPACQNAMLEAHPDIAKGVRDSRLLRFEGALRFSAACG